MRTIGTTHCDTRRGRSAPPWVNSESIDCSFQNLLYSFFPSYFYLCFIFSRSLQFLSFTYSCLLLFLRSLLLLCCSLPSPFYYIFRSRIQAIIPRGIHVAAVVRFLFLVLVRCCHLLSFSMCPYDALLRRVLSPLHKKMGAASLSSR